VGDACLFLASPLASYISGTSLLVHGGASGIGTTAIQLAAERGHRVFTTAGSDEKCARCLELGAELAVNYRDDDFVEKIKDATDRRGVNVILDMVGGDYVERNLACLAESGRVSIIAFLRGSRVEVDLLRLMLKRQVLTGSTLRIRSDEEKAAIAEALAREVWPLLESGAVAPVVDSVFPLAEAGAAHARMEEGSHVGKLLLSVG
ncbi:MAG: zinc-binding dehydrogenase, partial [Deltaproteobacteria bacterium]|nr:zinc-binding dehydrogenase [Deltaproteobacteria bacterium]